MQLPEDFNPVCGEAEALETGVRRIVAPNPSPMTWRGTNTYLLGSQQVAVIDPGPDSEPHLEAILAATDGGRSVSHIIVTHAHLDHSPLARRLGSRTGAPVLAFGPAHAGRSAAMIRLAATGLAGGGEGIDEDFEPDIRVEHGDLIECDDWSLRVLHTPGHIGNHICLAFGDLCFTGDHVMGWASSLVSPPDGDLTDFMTSCRVLKQQHWRVFFPGHGKQITSPNERLDWLISHRLGREAAILQALASGPATASDLAAAIYTDTPAALIPAATRNVLAHLIDLDGKKLVSGDRATGESTVYSLSQESAR